MGTGVVPTSDKSRRERRKEARLAKNKKKFDSWVQHHQSKKSSLDMKSESVKKRLTQNGTKDYTEQPQAVEKTKSKVKDFVSDGATDQRRSLKKSGIRKELKRKKDDNTAPKNNFFKLLEMETKGRVVSEEDDLRLERRLAKKLKVKNGKLRSANDDLDMLLEGISSDHYNTGGFGELDTSDQDDGKIDNSVNEELDDDIPSDEEVDDDIPSDEEVDDDIPSDEEVDDDIPSDEELDDDIPSDEELDDDIPSDEESDSIASIEEHEEVLEVTSGKDSNKRRKMKFEEHLEIENHGNKDDDGVNMLLEEVPPEYEKRSLDKGISYDNIDASTLEPQNKVQTRISSNIEASRPSQKYVAPHLRSNGGNESAELAQVRKRVRGLLNRLSETNVESITAEISALIHSVGRGVGSQIISEEVVGSCSGGPRGNEQYAAVFAAFVAGMACMIGIDFGAKLLARLAKCFEEEFLKEDNLSLRNLTLLLSYLYFFGVCSSELMYDFLIMLGKRLTEVDVSTVLTVLQCCGMKLRGDDPAGMKNFICSVQSRVNEMKASSAETQSNISNKRMEFMIETICDIKNNKKRSKEDTVQHTRIKKWLQKLRVDDILIRGLKWGKLVDPNKKGQWWLSGDIASTTENIEEVAGAIEKEIPETKNMLQLAASQRMNTDARRAIFCVIMSGEDYIDAFEKLLRLDLPGKQDREIMRVLVECCLQEKVFNKYYCVLASKLCSHDKNHKFTLQYCLWDHFKELESMSLIRSMHLSKFTAEMVASFTLSLAVLKAVDLSDLVHLTSKRIMHFRMLFEALFEFPDKLVWNIFTRIAVTPEYESLRCGIEFFVSKYVVSGKKPLASKFKIAKKALNNVEGVVM